MRKRNLKFALLLKDGRPVRSLTELKSYYDIDKIINYYNNGQLERWLEQNDYLDQLMNVQKLKKEIKYKLVETLDNILLGERDKSNDIENMLGKSKVVTNRDLDNKNRKSQLNQSEEIETNTKISEQVRKNREVVLPEIDLPNSEIKPCNLEEKENPKENIVQNHENKKKDFWDDGGISNILEEIGIKIENSNNLNKGTDLQNKDNADISRGIVQAVGTEKSDKIESREITNINTDKIDEKININNVKRDSENNNIIEKNNKLNLNINGISNSKSIKGNSKSFSAIGNTESLFEKAKSSSNLNLDKNKYNESDIMINRENLLKPKKKSILADLHKEKVLTKNDNSLVNDLNKGNGLNIQINNMGNKKDSIDKKSNNRLTINNIDVTEKDKYKPMNLNNFSQNNSTKDIKETIKDVEFEKISKIVTDPKSLKMLEDFYLKNKANIKNVSDVKTNIMDIKSNDMQEVQGNLSLKLDPKPIVEEENKKEVINKNVKEAEITVYNQEDYEEILNIRESSNTHLKIYVEFNQLKINKELENVQYIGTKKQVVYLDTDSCFDAIKKDISFKNLKISSKKQISFVCNSMEECTIDRTSIKKGIQDLIIKYPDIIVKNMECSVLKESDIEDGKSVEAFIEKVFSCGGNEQEILATARYEGVAIYTNVVMGMVDMAFLKDSQGEVHNISKIFANMENIDIFRKSPDIGIKFVALLRQQDLLTIEKRTNKKYKNSREALEDIFISDDAESYLPYVMLMPVKILRSNEELSRLDQIKLIEIMNLDTGIPYISRRFIGNIERVKEDIYEFIRTVSSSKELNDIVFNGVILEPINEEIRCIEEIPVEAIYKFKNQLYSTKVNNIRFLMDKNKKIVAYVDVDDIVTKDKVIKTVKFEGADKFKQLRLNIGDDVTVSVSKDRISLNKDLRDKISKGIHVPLICPFCGQNLNFREVDTFGTCENPQCEGSITSSIYTQLLDAGLCDSNMDDIVNLYKKGVLNNIEDLLALPVENLSKILNVNMDKVEEAKQNIKKRI